MYQIQGDEEEENEAAPKPGLFAHFNTKARVALVVAAALFIVLIGLAWKRGTTANTQAAILRTIRKETLEGMDSKEAPIDKLGEKITEKFKAIQERLANSEKSFAKEKAQINTKLLETQQQLQRTQQVAVQIKKELDRVAGQAQQMAQLLRRPEMINKIRAANIRPATITPKDKIAGIKDVPATSEGGWYSKVQGFCSTVANVAANVAAPIKDVTVAAYNKAKDAISPAETPTAKPGDDAIVQPSRAAAPTKPAAGLPGHAPGADASHPARAA